MTKSVSTLAAELPSVEDIRAGMHGNIPGQRPTGENATQHGGRPRQRGAKGVLKAKGRKDNAPPAILRRGQNR
ncbi:hypothetical protein [Sciscionella marina]|uniref:hypothetical protein n=1 Tax=Sciscionella marina TaxID=508770 RepID=UPI000377D086|nr:hypothetical protein [Sciscionella marina]